ncbi:d-stereospecific aminopeptidase [Paraburkholderia caribensis MBA4]|uniref:D-stereospecific aminopeptidase n=1 Tax=Paraburkholderia caribensis MBA4 TaxID=1323664 RepID=A0A0P0RE76_9BURK|nr:d-stereospecific aminopeptidase [Paraburkholderia caribensis MBA4]
MDSTPCCFIEDLKHAAQQRHVAIRAADGARNSVPFGRRSSVARHGDQPTQHTRRRMWR